MRDCGCLCDPVVMAMAKQRGRVCGAAMIGLQRRRACWTDREMGDRMTVGQLHCPHCRNAKFRGTEREPTPSPPIIQDPSDDEKINPGDSFHNIDFDENPHFWDSSGFDSPRVEEADEDINNENIAAFEEKEREAGRDEMTFYDTNENSYMIPCFVSGEGDEEELMLPSSTINGDEELDLDDLMKSVPLVASPWAVVTDVTG